MGALLRFCLIASLLLLVSGCAQYYYYFPPTEPEPVLVTIHIIDRNGFSETISNPDRLEKFEKVDFLSEQPYQKVLRVYSRDQWGDVHAYITSYHPSGHPKQYLELVNNRANGWYREWHANGLQKLEAFIIGGDADLTVDAQKSWLFDGLSSAWDECGHLIAEIPYDNGALEGCSNYYHTNGTLWKRIPCHKGDIEGTSEIYLDTGVLLQSNEYLNGSKHGLSRRYWDGSLVASDEIYNQGRLMTGRYFNRNGEQVASIKDGEGFRTLFGKEAICEIQEYHRGELDGAVKVFDPCGNLLRIHHIKNEIKNGEEIEYYDPIEVQGKPQPKLSINWADGRIQGLVKTWFPNGVQESQREMSSNAKNGILTAWYKDGSLMLIEKYDQDKLIDGQYFVRGEKIPISEVHGGRGTATLYDPDGGFLRKVQYTNSKPAEQ